MGVLVAIIGVIVVIVGLVNGMAVTPASAPQQAVQELRFVEAAIGALMFAMGCAVYQLEQGRKPWSRDREFDEMSLNPDMKLSGRTRGCLHCTGRIRIEAKVCRFCSHDVEPITGQAP